MRRGPTSATGKEVLTTAAVAVSVGFGVAALGALGFAAGAAAAAGVLTATSVSSQGSRHSSRAPVQEQEVKRDEEGCIENWPQLLKAVQQGGVAPELRADLWPLLLGVFSPASSTRERAEELERLQRLYTKLVLVCQELDSQLEAVRSRAGDAEPAVQPAAEAAASATAVEAAEAAGRGTAVESAAAAAMLAAEGEVLGEEEEEQEPSTPRAASASPPQPGVALTGSPGPPPGNLAAFAEAHRIVVLDAVRTDLRPAQRRQVAGSGGAPGSPTVTVLPVALGDGLPELMLVNPPEPEPAAAVAAGRLPLWRSRLAADVLGSAGHVTDAARRQMLRLVNLLSAYSVHDPETGYCQGMSDLAAIFVQLFEDDALAFACFERLMRSARRNFKHDETGIKQQLRQVARILRDTDPSLYRKLAQLGAEDCMFAYRMVVVMLRRELPPQQCCTLWEMQWAHEAAEVAAAAAKEPATVAGMAAAAVSNGGGSGSLSSSGTLSAIKTTVQGMGDAAARAASEGAAAGSGGSRPGTPSAAALGSGRRPGSGRLMLPADEEEVQPQFVVQFIAAAVRALRARILGECREHDDVLRLFNAIKIDFWLALAQARKQHKAYARGMAVLQRL